MRGWRPAVLGALLSLGPTPAATADLLLPPGFTATVYVTGDGFPPDAPRGVAGIPSTSTLAVDDAGLLYLARTGRRYFGGESDDLWPIYRIPVGGARLTPDTEARYFHGPPLPSAQVAAVRAGPEVLVTTFDRERGVGVVYRIRHGRAELFAGGTPPPGTPPLLVQPEGAAVDAAGDVYVADRSRGRVVRLDASGRVVDPRYLVMTRPRVVAAGHGRHLWVGSDGTAQAPWQPGQGEIWRVSPDGGPARVVLRGPVPAGIAVGPAGHLFVADRQAAQIFVLSPDGRRTPFAHFTGGDAPRGLGFAPVTPATRRSGIAGDLFVVRIAGGAWPVNEILRISGPFGEVGAAPTSAQP